MRMCDDHILVKPLPDPRSHIIEVILTERSGYGTVMAIGPGKQDKKGRRVPLQLQVGDVVRYGRFDFETHEGHLIMQEADVAGIVE